MGDTATKVIRPLDLDKAETSDIYHHGGALVKDMERLKERGHFPQTAVFTVRIPDQGKRLYAAKKICEELVQIGVQPIEFSDMQCVRQAVSVEDAA